MYSLFDFWQNGLDGRATIQEVAPLLKKYGIRGVNTTPDMLENEKVAKEAAKCLADNGLKWGLLATPMDALSEDLSDEAFDAGLEKLKRWAEVGEKIGVKYSYNHIWNGSNTRQYEENYEWSLIRLRRIWKVMDDHGINYGFEFLGPQPLRNSFKYPFFQSVAGALAFADEISPRCGFAFDTYHWYCGSDCNMGDLYLAAQHVDRMVNFHINDGLAGKKREEQEDLERAMPLTTGVIDARVPYRLFEAKGYAGPVMCEALMPWIRASKNKTTEQIIKELAEAYERIAAASK